MTSSSTASCILLAVAVLLTVGKNAHADEPPPLSMPPLFGDHMVFQCGLPVPIWGNGAPGMPVRADFNGQTKTTEIQADGTWKITLDKMTAGGPYDLTVTGKETIVISNVMVGEVWIGAGQSNMEMPLKNEWAQVLNCDQEIAGADHPDIRLFQVEHHAADRPVHNLSSEGWKPCTPQTVPGFSAAMYFFARTLHQRMGIPIGLIQTTWSGTPIENWMSGDVIFGHPQFREIVLNMPREEFTLEKFHSLYETQVDAWSTALRQHVRAMGIDTLDREGAPFPSSKWSRVDLPQPREVVGSGLHGVSWFRKEMDLPDGARTEATLSLGPIHDFDITWFNGEEIGHTAGRRLLREYPIPAELLQPGRNVITVMVLNIGYRRGFFGLPKQMCLKKASGDTFPLAGPWESCVVPTAVDIALLPPGPPSRDNRPTVIFNGQIAPLIPYAMRGVLWYQGEANADRAHQYRALFPALITDWRAKWAQGDFPFLFVQLANYGTKQTLPTDDEWAELREAQQMTLSLPNTGMAVTIDIGDANDIHPRNKQEVGRRLALNALQGLYGLDVPCSGPIFHSLHIRKDRARLTFKHAKALVTPKGEQLEGFAVAGEDRAFHWAHARIEGKSVIVSSHDVPRPLAVRYAWGANPIGNLYNTSGLPAAPFRTDTWDGITVGNR